MTSIMSMVYKFVYLIRHKQKQKIDIQTDLQDFRIDV